MLLHRRQVPIGGQIVRGQRIAWRHTGKRGTVIVCHADRAGVIRRLLAVDLLVLGLLVRVRLLVVLLVFFSLLVGDRAIDLARAFLGADPDHGSSLAADLAGLRL